MASSVTFRPRTARARGYRRPALEHTGVRRQLLAADKLVHSARGLLSASAPTGSMGSRVRAALPVCLLGCSFPQINLGKFCSMLKRRLMHPTGTMLQVASNYRALFEEMAAGDENLSLAMVPWAPAKVHAHAASSSTSAGAEMMDADQDGDGASMEIEHGVEGQTTPPMVGALQGEAFHHHYQQQHQWPAPHCVASPQLQLPAASYQPSPVTWSW
ncbi:unnamed protein product [Miscanthus lutarioriparius]|uniref:Uncharacterized protein n=1 Tax=Miscanthus lutarioriparius TaxID=422564 RepID=A0A811RGY4_9POAL|nr:unnamed protein product [Miscanthus lutarioriparius]